MRYYCAFFTLCLSSSFFKEISRVVTFLALFNFQDAVQLSAFWAVQLFYYITSLTVCQVLFSSFFKKLFRTLDFRCLSSDSLSIISHLSELVKWFLKSFLFNFLRGYFHSLSQKSFKLSPLIHLIYAIFRFLLSFPDDSIYYITLFTACQLKLYSIFSSLFV